MRALGRLHTYQRSVAVLFSLLLAQPKPPLLMAFITGFLSKILYLMGFVITIKLVSSPEKIDLLAGEVISFNGWLLIICTLFLGWAFSTRQFRVMLAKLEGEVGLTLLSWIRHAQNDFYKDISSHSAKLSNGELKKLIGSMPRLCTALMVALLVLPVILIVLAALFYVNTVFTSILLLGIFLLALLMPGIHKRNRQAREIYRQETLEGSDAVKSLLASDISRQNDLETVNIQQIKKINDSLIKTVSSSEAGVLLINLFIVFSFFSLLGWYTLNARSLDTSQLTMLVIYLVLVRFFSSNIGSFFKSLGTVNLGLHDLVKLNHYLDYSNATSSQAWTAPQSGIRVISIDRGTKMDSEGMLAMVRQWNLFTGPFSYCTHTPDIDELDINITNEYSCAETWEVPETCQKYFSVGILQENSLIRLSREEPDYNFDVLSIALKSKLEHKVLILPDVVLREVRKGVLDFIVTVSEKLPVFLVTEEKRHEFDLVDRNALRRFIRKPRPSCSL